MTRIDADSCRSDPRESASIRVIRGEADSRYTPLTLGTTPADLRPYAVAIAGVAAVAALLAPIGDRVSPTTVSLALLLVVLFVAAWRGMGPALAAAVAGVLAFNFFFLPPLGTFTIADPQNWVALAAFLVTAV